MLILHVFPVRDVVLRLSLVLFSAPAAKLPSALRPFLGPASPFPGYPLAPEYRLSAHHMLLLALVHVPWLCRKLG